MAKKLKDHMLNGRHKVPWAVVPPTIREVADKVNELIDEIKELRSEVSELSERIDELEWKYKA